MKEVYYKQCRMRKDNKNGSYSEQVSYIPEPYCVLNKVLKLKDENGNWDNGWVVTQVNESRVEDSKLPDYRQNVRNHRKATGDSLPKTADDRK